MSKLEEFLKDLTELTIKHGIIIGACGCCDSPYLYGYGEVPTSKSISADRLRFDAKRKTYKAVDKGFAGRSEYTTIKGEQYETSSTRLDLSGKGLQNDDIVPLRSMANLVSLDLSDNEISDITPLIDLVNLDSLVITGNPFTNWAQTDNIIFVPSRPRSG
jgi:Leucine-rich repeat (LRR) protein